MIDATRDVPCVVLEWDSAFWGFPVARLQGESLAPESMAGIDNWCRQHAIACLFFLATFDDPVTVHTAEGAGFGLTDARVTFGRTPAQLASSAPPEGSQGPIIRPNIESDIEPLQRIAAVSHRDSRFYFDLHFPRHTCELLYERWIALSCAGYADHVLVADEDGAAVGYITCHRPAGGEQAGRIGLVGVASHARGHGVGTRLVLHALDWFARQQVETVTVVTQGRNISAQVLYQRCGFVTRSHELWYHKWYRLPELTSS